MSQFLGYKSEDGITEANISVAMNSSRMTVSVLGSGDVKCEVKPYGMEEFEEIEQGVIDASSQKSITVDGVFEKVKLTAASEFRYSVAFQS